MSESKKSFPWKILLLLILALAGFMFFSNPNQADFQKHVESTGKDSLEKARDGAASDDPIGAISDLAGSGRIDVSLGREYTYKSYYLFSLCTVSSASVSVSSSLSAGESEATYVGAFWQIVKLP